MTLRCRHKVPRPELAGRMTWSALREAAEEYPELRPCPKSMGRYGRWEWIDRKACEKCADAVEVEENQQGE